MFYINRSYLKKRILLEYTATLKFQPGGIYEYFKDLKLSENKGIWPKFFFETTSDKKAFTLIELIASILLVSFISAVLGMGIVHIVDAFLLSKENANNIQKCQIVMRRIVKELEDAKTIINASANSISFTKNQNGNIITHSISYISGSSEIRFDNIILADGINRFRFEYYETYDEAPPSSNDTTGGYSGSEKLVQIELAFDNPDSSPFLYKNRIFLRRLGS